MLAAVHATLALPVAPGLFPEATPVPEGGFVATGGTAAGAATWSLFTLRSFRAVTPSQGAAQGVVVSAVRATARLPGETVPTVS